MQVLKCIYGLWSPWFEGQLRAQDKKDLNDGFKDRMLMPITEPKKDAG